MTASKNGSLPVKARRLRLVKVMVQPVFVLDDGDDLREAVGGVVTVMASDWDDWSAKAFTAEALAGIEATVEADG